MENVMAIKGIRSRMRLNYEMNTSHVCPCGCDNREDCKPRYTQDILNSLAARVFPAGVISVTYSYPVDQEGRDTRNMLRVLHVWDHWQRIPS